MQWSKALRIVFVLLLPIIGGILLQNLLSGHGIQTDFKALLPNEQRWSQTQLLADQQQEQQLNRQFVALIGHQNADVAFSLTENLAEQWQKSGLFSAIFVKNQPNLTALQTQISELKIALLPPEIRQQLLSEPQHYFSTYAEQLTNPFQRNNLLPLEQDWLGLGRFPLTTAQMQSQMQWNADNGMIYREQDGLTWVLLRAELSNDNALAQAEHILTLVADNQQFAEQHQATLLQTSTTIFSAQAKQNAEQESTLMATLGLGLTLLLLLILFRTARILWLFLPILIAMMYGITTTILLFGQIHILTIVIGTSLIGVLIDFPLHWLASSLTHTSWQAEAAMKKLTTTFLVSLSITLLGYLLLGFTTLPILQQTAVFSAAALISAVAFTLLFLPSLFKYYQPQPKRSILQKRKQIQPVVLKKIRWVVGLLFIGLSAGIFQSKWQDDMRDWVALPPTQLQQLQHISHLTGIDFGSQYFLLNAENQEKLLEIDQHLSQLLSQLQQQGKISRFQSLSQWYLNENAQRTFTQQLQQLPAENYAILEQVGIPQEMISKELRLLAQTSPISLDKALASDLGQAWRTLYLGQLKNGRFASIVKIAGLNDLSAISSLTLLDGVEWQDKRSHLNQAFQDTRDLAAWLKILSFLFAGGLLWRLFGIRRSVKMLTIPLIAIGATVGIFGWLGIPISLFTMFGLLLISAIGIDYTAYLYTAEESIATKRLAITLACLTTLISFALLSFSSTPAVRHFGLSVSGGIALTWLLVQTILLQKSAKNMLSSSTTNHTLH